MTEQVQVAKKEATSFTQTRKSFVRLIIECILRNPAEERGVWKILETAYKEKRKLEKQTRQRQIYPIDIMSTAITTFKEEVADEEFNRATETLNTDDTHFQKALERVHTILKTPDIKVGWVRFQDYFAFSRPLRMLALGIQGSGKSSLLEVLAIRYPKIFDLYGCYDEKTELLTKKGWTLFKEVTYNDEVATLSEDGFLEYHKPLAIQKYHYEGEMIRFFGKRSGYDLLVTPDHRMYVKPVFAKDFRFVRANALIEHVGTRGISTYRFKRDVKWNCSDVEHFELPVPSPTKHTQELMLKYEEAMKLVKEKWKIRSRNPFTGCFAEESKWTYRKIATQVGVHEGTISKWVRGKANPKKLYHHQLLGKIQIDTFLRFLGWYLSEGNVACKVQSVDIAQSNKQNRKEIYKIFKKMGRNPHIQKNGVRVHWVQLARYCKQFGHAPNKFIPYWVKQLPPKRLLVLINTMLKGDGSRGCVYYTSSKQLADDFQEICIKASYGASVTKRPERKKLPKIRGRTNKHKYPSYEVSIAWKTPTPRICTTPQIEQYDGWIYDVTVPNHVIMVRRNGKAVWCGNSSDSEGLCWCKKEFEWFFTHLYGRPPRILLITGNDIALASKHTTKKISEINGLRDFADYDIITIVYAFFTSEKKYFATLQKITHILWHQRTYWREPWFVLVREAADWVYARLKVVKDDSAAKKEFVKDYRQARHHGLAIGVDTLRWTNIDKEIRDLADYTFFKAPGDAGLPRDLHWLYRYFQPLRLMQLKPNNFGLKTARGAVGFGRFDYPQWHKEEAENILKSTGIEVRHLQQTLPDDRRYGVGDFDHAEIIEKYIELRNMHKVAKTVVRSPDTVKKHIDLHNQAIERKEECPKCHHAKCEFSKDTIIVNRRRSK